MTGRRLAAILAADVAGFSAAMAQDEDGTLRDLQDLRARVDPILTGHGGRIASTAGDSLVVEFPSVADAVDAAVEVQRETIDGPLRLRVGVNLGDVIVTDDGDVFGDGVNIAARLEGMADTGGVVVSGSVRDSLRGRSPVGFDDLGLLRLKHIAEPVHAYRARIGQEAAPAAPPAAPAPTETSELLEREEEMRLLREALDTVVGGTGRIVVVGGEAGIGKSSLVRALAAEATADVLWGWCDDLVTPRALGPFHDMAPALGPSFAAALSADPRPEVILRALHDELAAGPPRLVVLEDLHWADDATFDALKFLGRRISRLPILLTVTVRDVGAARVRAALADAPPGSVVRLQPAPLSAAAIASMAGDPASAERLRRLTNGNPFFVSEVLQAGSDEVPNSVQDAVLARLESLADDVRRIVEVASVGPTRLEIDVIGRVTAVTDRALDDVEAARILVVDDVAVAFRHELARRAVEASLSPRDRRSINARVLEALESTDADPARLVHHAEQSADADAIVRHATAAAQAAGRSSAHREAAAHWQRALDHDERLDRTSLLEALDGFARETYFFDADRSVAARERRLGLHREAGDVHGMSEDLRWLARLSWFQGRGADARELAEEAIEVLSGQPPSEELARAYSSRAQLAMLAGDVEGALEWGHRAMDLAAEFDLPDVRAHAMVNVATVSRHRDPAAAAATLREARDLARGLGDEEETARAWTNLAWNFTLGRRYQEAEAEAIEAFAFSVEHELEGFAAYQQATLGWIRLETGRWDEAVADARASLAVSAVPSVARIPALVVEATVAARTGDVDRAMRMTEEAWKLAEPSGEAQRIGPVAALRAEIAWLRDDTAEAVAAVSAVPALVSAGDARYAGDLARWFRLTDGGTPIDDAFVPAPHDLEVAGRFEEAAVAWAELGCPYDEAIARYEAGQVEAAIALLERLGASAVIARISRSAPA